MLESKLKTITILFLASLRFSALSSLLKLKIAPLCFVSSLAESATCLRLHEQSLIQSFSVKQKELFKMFNYLLTGRHTFASLLREFELEVMLLFFALVSFSLFISYKISCIKENVYTNYPDKTSQQICKACF